MGIAAIEWPRRLSQRSVVPLVLGAAMMFAGWAMLWSVVSFWNPVAFWAMWTGFTLLMWQAARSGYPGLARHAALALVSVPLWWWFELVNETVQNWHYVSPYDRGFTALGGLSRLVGWGDLVPSESSALWYTLQSSLAFSTVVPAVVAATALVRGLARVDEPSGRATRQLAWAEIGAGALLQVLVFTLPNLMYPFVWVAPLLFVDGIGALVTGRGFVAGLLRFEWRDAAAVGAAGLLCGVAWEFWNYWSVPSWEYSVPGLGFWKLFEMPVLGYGGYVPFAWSIVRLVQVLDAVWLQQARRRGAGETSG